MDKLVDSSTRGPMDYFHFALAFFGFLILATGIVLTSIGLTIFGGLLEVFALLFFLVRN